MLFFFPRGVLDEILNLIESVSEGFPSYFFIETNLVSASVEIQFFMVTAPAVGWYGNLKLPKTCFLL